MLKEILLCHSRRLRGEILSYIPLSARDHGFGPYLSPRRAAISWMNIFLSMGLVT